MSTAGSDSTSSNVPAVVLDQFTAEYLYTGEHGARARRPLRRARGSTSTGAGRLPWLLLLLAGVDATGVMLSVLQVPARARALGGDDVAISVLVGVFFAAQTLGATLLGRLSDRIGRRPVLLTGLVATLLAHLLLAESRSIELLLATRILHGLGAGTAGVLLAALADRVPIGERARQLGWLGGAASLGAVLGPGLVLGAGRLAPVRPEHVAAALTLAALAAAWRRLPTGASVTPRPAPAPGPAAVATAVASRSPSVRWLLATYTLAAGAASGAPAMLPVLLRGTTMESGIGPDVAAAAWGIMFLGGAGCLLRSVAVGPTVSRLGERRALAVGLAILAASLFLLAVVGGPVLLGVALGLLAVGTALTFPTLGALVILATPAGRHGATLGVQQALGGVARASFPLALGLAAGAASAALPLVLAGAALLGLALRQLSPSGSLHSSGARGARVARHASRRHAA